MLVGDVNSDSVNRLLLADQGVCAILFIKHMKMQTFSFVPEITSEITCRELHLSRCSDLFFFNPSGGILHQLGSLTQRLIHEGKAYTHDSIPEAWASYFATPVATPSSEEQLKILAAYHRNQSLPAIEPDLVSQEEVVVFIHSLPLRKAAGPDHITNEHLKFRSSGLPTMPFFWSYPCLL